MPADASETRTSQSAPHEGGAPSTSSPRMRRMGAWAALGAIVLVVDQLTKVWARDALSPVGTVGVQVVPDVLSFELVHNYGAAFGMGQGMGWLSVLLAVVIVAASAVYLMRARTVNRFELVGLGLVLGGAVGNAVDRVVFGYVTDFIYACFIDFPVFNVADIGVTVGVALAFVGFAFLSPAMRGGDESGKKTEGGDR